MVTLSTKEGMGLATDALWFVSIIFKNLLLYGQRATHTVHLFSWAVHDIYTLFTTWYIKSLFLFFNIVCCMVPMKSNCLLLVCHNSVTHLSCQVCLQSGQCYKCTREKTHKHITQAYNKYIGLHLKRNFTSWLWVPTLGQMLWKPHISKQSKELKVCSHGSLIKS